MSSLRLAIKLSIAENKDSVTVTSIKSKSEDESTDVIVGRKRKQSADLKEPRKKLNKDKGLSSDSFEPSHRLASWDETFDSRDDQDLKVSLSKSASINNFVDQICEVDLLQDVTESKNTIEDPDDTVDQIWSDVNPTEQSTLPDTANETSEINSSNRVNIDSIEDLNQASENDFLVAQTSVDESIDEQNSEMILGPSESFDGVHEAEGDIVLDSIKDDVEGASRDAPTGVKKRKKRTPSILKDLEILAEVENSNGNDADGEDNQNGSRYQSSRNAAKVAKTKFAAGRSNRTASGDGTSKSGRKAQSHSSNSTGGTDNVSMEIAVKTEWIQCDNCSKWRSIPPSAGINVDTLPEKWFCNMNTWDNLRNECDAAEENYQTVDAVPADNRELENDAIGVVHVPAPKDEKATPVAVKGRGKGKGKKVSVVDGEENCLKLEESVLVAKELPASGRKRGAHSMKNVSNRSSLSADGTSIQAVSWVQCNKCKKWRKAPNADNFPEKWYCSLNTWNPQYASCSVRQEEDDTTNENNLLQQTPHRGGKKGPNLATVGVSSVSTAASVCSAPIGAAAAVVKKINWVQCERKGCKKWRKVPVTIDVKIFNTGKWYCEMNTWNAESASCDAPEDVDSEAERNDNEPRNQFILSSSKGPTALSYRRIIFGNDGKIKACFSDKNKNGYGLFSYTQIARKPAGNSEEEEEYVEPMKKITYWWSSAYNDKLITSNSLTTLRLPETTPTYLLDTVRRVYDSSESLQPQHSFPKKVNPAWSILQALPLIARCKAECSVIRSCFLASNQTQITLRGLASLVQKCKFLNPIIESCREFMSINTIRDTLRHLEESDEVDIAFTSNNEMIITLLLPFQTLRSIVASRSKVFHKKENKPAFGVKWSKLGVPLKLRKFYAKRYLSKPPTSLNDRLSDEANHTASSDNSDYENSRLEYCKGDQQDQFDETEEQVPDVDRIINTEDFQQEERSETMDVNDEEYLEHENRLINE